MVNQSIVFDPSVDERKLDKEVDSIDKRLEDTGQISPEIDDSGLGLDGVDSGISGGDGGMGVGGTAGAAGLAKKLPKPVSGVAFGSVLPVALGGAAAAGMLSAMHSASASLQTSTSLLGVAWDRVWRPLGNDLDQLFVRDVARSILKATGNFEEYWTEGKWIKALESLVDLDKLALDIGTATANAIGDKMEFAFEEDADDIFEFEKWTKEDWRQRIDAWRRGDWDPKLEGVTKDMWLQRVDKWRVENWETVIAQWKSSDWGDHIDPWTRKNWRSKVRTYETSDWDKKVTDVDLNTYVSSTDLNDYVEGTQLDRFVEGTVLDEFVTGMTTSDWRAHVAEWKLTDWENQVETFTESRWASKVDRWSNWSSKIDSVDMEDFVDPAHTETDPPPPPGCDPPCGPNEFCRGGVCVPARREPPPNDGGDGPGAPPGGPMPMQSGGVVNRRTAFAAGEAGPEVVQPLSEFRRLMEGVAREAARSGGGGNVDMSRVESELQGIRRDLKALAQAFNQDIVVDGERFARLTSETRHNQGFDTDPLIG